MPDYIKSKKVNMLCFTIILAGIFLRVLCYSYNRPFWNDECALAFNIIDFNFIKCFKALSYNQAAPPLFLVISGLFSKIIPDIELALRFFPLISSILSIFVFYNLSKHIFNKKSSIILALILFCFNYRLICYSQEFKQYSTDILIFLGILTSYFYIKIQDANLKKLLTFGIAYSVCIWFSFISAFGILALFGILTLKNIKSFKKIFILFLPAIISFGCFYFTQQHLSSSNILHNYWKDGFISQNFSNFLPLIINYFSYAFNSIIIFLFFFIGLILNLTKIKNDKNLIMLLPVFIAMGLSYFSVYPLESRVSLYLIPVCILFSVQIIDYINFKNKFVNYIVLSIIMFFMALPIIINSSYKILFKNFNMENIISPLNIANKNMKDGDILYVPDGSTLSYNFYKSDYNFKNVMIEEKRINNSEEYLKALEKLPKNKTYYYIFCHFPAKEKRLKDVYAWAKNKKDFKIYTDKDLNALIVFTQQ